MNVVEFKADRANQKVRILERAKAGRLKDIAVVTAEIDPDAGPMHAHFYYGQGAFATIVAGVASLAFSLQYDGHKASEGRG